MKRRQDRMLSSRWRQYIYINLCHANGFELTRATPVDEMYGLKNTPEGRELLWRQRLQKRVYDQLLKETYKSNSLLLVAVWNDRRNKGTTIHNAKKIPTFLTQQ